MIASTFTMALAIFARGHALVARKGAMKARVAREAAAVGDVGDGEISVFGEKPLGLGHAAVANEIIEVLP